MQSLLKKRSSPGLSSQFVPAQLEPATSATRKRRVALLIDTATSWGAGLIEGIANYSKLHDKEWVFSLEPRGRYEKVMLADEWHGDGVIARVTHLELAEALIARGLPVVDVSWFAFGDHRIPRCTCDEAETASLAVQYFLDQGYRNFAYCASMLRRDYYDRFGQAFVAGVEAAGFRCVVFSQNQEEFSRLSTDLQLQMLSQWLSQLPPPCALVAFDGLQGRQVTEACAQAGLAVPDRIAVLSGEHDDLCSRISTPPLSGIDHGPERVGFHAAYMLDRQMAGLQLDKRAVFFPPQRIVPRKSTDKIAISDELLAAAIAYIHEHSAENMRIRDILAAVPISRRTLEIGFRQQVGRTPREELRRVRVLKAIEMISDTNLSLGKIATECGFGSSEVMTRAFRTEVSCTPSNYRKGLRRID